MQLSFGIKPFTGSQEPSSQTPTIPRQRTTKSASGNPLISSLRHKIAIFEQFPKEIVDLRKAIYPFLKNAKEDGNTAVFSKSF